MESTRTQDILNIRSELPSTNDVLVEALRQRADLFTRVGEERSRRFISQALEEIGQLELVARDRSALAPRTPQEASQVKAIIVLSAAGTYLKPVKDDRYKDFGWARGMDHERLNLAGYMMRKITEMKTGRKLTNDPELFREYTEKYGPDLLYSGRPDEIEDVLKSLQASYIHLPQKDRRQLLSALELPNVYMPPERVHILKGEIDNTVHQIQQLYVPEEIGITSEDTVGLVVHTPQAVRVLRNIQSVVDANKQAYENGQQAPFPNFPFRKGGPRLKIYPLAIPRDPDTHIKTKQYPTLEICGMIYYTFYSSPPLTAETSYPHQT